MPVDTRPHQLYLYLTGCIGMKAGVGAMEQATDRGTGPGRATESGTPGAGRGMPSEGGMAAEEGGEGGSTTSDLTRENLPLCTSNFRMRHPTELFTP